MGGAGGGLATPGFPLPPLQVPAGAGAIPAIQPPRRAGPTGSRGKRFSYVNPATKQQAALPTPQPQQQLQQQQQYQPQQQQIQQQQQQQPSTGLHPFRPHKQQGFHPFQATQQAGFDPQMGLPQAAAFFGMNGWNGGGGDGARQPVRLPAIPLPAQSTELENACYAIASCYPQLPADRAPGLFAVASSGKILTIRTPRDWEDLIANNPRQDEQCWSLLNATIAVLTASKSPTDRAILEQFESLVQPTQFLEYIRKSLPMSEGHLDMVTVMHDRMTQRLNVLQVLYKGGRRR
jgi:hypothetical protein